MDKETAGSSNQQKPKEKLKWSSNFFSRFIKHGKDSTKSEVDAKLGTKKKMSKNDGIQSSMHDFDENRNIIEDANKESNITGGGGPRVHYEDDEEAYELNAWGGIFAEPDTDLPEKIFSQLVTYLSRDDIRNARLVSALWYHYITSSPKFWDRMKILTRIKPEDGEEGWNALSNSELVTVYNCQDYHLRASDLTLPAASSFLNSQGPTMTYLTLERCYLSPTRLQTILYHCTSLEYLNLAGIPNCVVFCEAIFTNTIEPNHIPNLKTLKLRSSFERAWTPDPSHHHVKNTNLHLNVVKDFLSLSNKLECIHFSGWGSRTAAHAIEYILSQRRGFLHLTQFYFENIPMDYLNFEHFHLLGSSFGEGIDLRKLSITLYSTLPIETASYHSAFANIIFRDILNAHRHNLESLKLDRCPVEDKIFGAGLPRLRNLSIKHTQVEVNKSKFGTLMPRLKQFEHSTHHSVFDSQPNPLLGLCDPFLIDEDLEYDDEATNQQHLSYAFPQGESDRFVTGANIRSQRVLERTNIGGIGSVWKFLLGFFIPLVPACFVCVELQAPQYYGWAYIAAALVLIVVIIILYEIRENRIAAKDKHNMVYLFKRQ